MGRGFRDDPDNDAVVKCSPGVRALKGNELTGGRVLAGRGILALAGLCGVTRRSRDCLSPGALETWALIGRLGVCCGRLVYVRRPVSGVDTSFKIVFVEKQALED